MADAEAHPVVRVVGVAVRAIAVYARPKAEYSIPTAPITQDRQHTVVGGEEEVQASFALAKKDLDRL